MSWVLLTYQVPREPSTPRIAIWRWLRRLGVASLADGLVALPEDARTREQLEWVADRVEAAGGSATLWRAQTLSVADERSVAGRMAAARAQEYQRIIGAAQAALAGEISEQPRHLRRLRRELRQVRRRDFFAPKERQRAQAAVEALADSAHADADAKALR